MSPTPSLSVRHLTSAYRVGPSSRATTRTVLHDIHLDASMRDLIVVTGPRGAGKTSLLLCLTGLLRPAEGRIRWQIPRSRIAYVPQARTYYGFLTIREAIDYYMPIAVPSADRDAVIGRALVRMGLSDMAHLRISTLSDACLRRLRLAHALASRPRALLADELLTGADSETAAMLANVLSAFTHAGGIVIAAEADPSVLATFPAARALVLPGPPYRH